MKRLAFVLSLALVVTLCAAQVPPLPPGYTPPKKKVVLMSPKHAAQITVRMAKASLPSMRTLLAMAALEVPTGVIIERVQIQVAETDGANVTNSAVSIALKFTIPNPTKGNYTIMASDDLSNWTTIKTGAGDDPIELYDFTYLTQTKFFYKFTILQ